MKINRLIQGFLKNNTFIIENEGLGILIDPGLSKDKIEEFINNVGVKIVAIIITHGHFDHVGSAKYFGKKYNASIYINQKDSFLLEEPYNNLKKGLVGPEIETDFKYTNLDDKVLIDGFEFQVIHTPGHTPGSSCVYFPQLKAVFTGDTLFFETIGRTDFVFSDEKEIILSIKKKLFKLPNETLVWPGHGQKTYISYEKENNKYLK